MNATGQETMSMIPAITGPQMIAMTVLTLFFLGAGVFIAAFCGDFSMHPPAADRHANVGREPDNLLILWTDEAQRIVWASENGICDYNCIDAIQDAQATVVAACFRRSTHMAMFARACGEPSSGGRWPSESGRASDESPIGACYQRPLDKVLADFHLGII